MSSFQAQVTFLHYSMAGDDFTDTMIQDDDNLCPICYAELEEDVQLLPCAHKFHLDCILEYAGAQGVH